MRSIPVELPPAASLGMPGRAGGCRPAVWAPVHLALLSLVLVALAGGLLRSGDVRACYVLGAGMVGWLAWREGPARSVETVILLFAVTPFLRRIVDQGVGFDPTGLMLLGPMLAALVPTIELRDALLRPVPADRDLRPHLIVGLCVGYGLMLSAFAGEVTDGAIVALKFYGPLLYGAWVLRRARDDAAILPAAIRAFLVVTPAMGAYAIWQYVNPPDWDRYWMVSSQMLSAGLPEPYKLRAFSTMNGPGVFAIYSVCGLLIIGFCRRGLVPALLALPVAVGLLLSLFRTGWIAFAIGVFTCGLFSRLRGRAVILVAAVLAAAALALSTTEMGDVVAERLATLGGSPAEDGSGQERLQQYVIIYTNSERYLVGQGLALLRAPFNGIAPVDGDVVAAMLTMGLVVGSIFLLAVVWAGVQALLRIRATDSPELLVACAFIAGLLPQLPLTGISSGEIGLLFWLFVGIATSRSQLPALRGDIDG
jgi:hypothetical protein